MFRRVSFVYELSLEARRIGGLKLNRIWLPTHLVSSQIQVVIVDQINWRVTELRVQYDWLYMLYFCKHGSIFSRNGR